MVARVKLRKEIRERRRALSPILQQQASELLLQRLSTYKKIQTAKNIALYLANDGELDLMPFIEWCWQENKQVYLPVLHPFCIGQLLFLLYEKSSTLINNNYGIKEPKLEVNKVCPLNQLDVLCTPLVAFDSSGARLGMGGGFYDRTLVNWQQKKVYPIGLAHDCQQVDKVPVELWDIPLPEIITPTKNYLY